MASGSCIRTMWGGAMIVAVSIALDIVGAGADDSILGQPSAIDAGAAAIENTGGGRRLWSRQPGTSSYDTARGVAADQDGNVYVVGETGPYMGNTDAWVIKFDSHGNRLWSRQPGTSEGDSARGVATDRDGNVYVVGVTDGALGGPHKGDKGYADAWVIKFDASGQRLWSRQPGDDHIDTSTGVATDKDGNVYVVGATDGALGGPLKGYYDAWVIKYAR